MCNWDINLKKKKKKSDVMLFLENTLNTVIEIILFMTFVSSKDI